MKPYNLYKHRKNTDVAFMPKAIEVGKVVYKVKGDWWNIQSYQPYPITNDTIEIKLNDLPHWRPYVFLPKHRK